MPDRFPSPFEIVAPTGAEGWEELYGYSTVFSEDRREMEESMFWFMDGVHTPEVIEPWDATVLDYAITFLGQYTTRHYVIPPALGVDIRYLNGHMYLSPVGVTDPAEIESRVPEFMERAGYYFANWGTLYDAWMDKIKGVIGELEAIDFQPLPHREDMAVLTEGRGIGSGQLMMAEYDKLVQLTGKLWAHHFEFLNLGYAAYLDFFGFCKTVWPSIPDQAIAKMVAGIDVDLFRPDEELKKLAQLAVDLGVGDRISSSAADTIAAMGADDDGKKWLEQWEESHHPWFNFSAGSGFYHSDKIWAEYPDIPMNFIESYVAKLGRGESLARPIEAIETERDRIVAEYSELIDDPEAKATFEGKLGLARVVFPYVENHNFYVEHWGMSQVWGKMRQLGQLLADQGFWANADDIFLLRRTEVPDAIFDYFHGWSVGVPARGPKYWGREIPRRQRDHERVAHLVGSPGARRTAGGHHRAVQRDALGRHLRLGQGLARRLGQPRGRAHGLRRLTGHRRGARAGDPERRRHHRPPARRDPRRPADRSIVGAGVRQDRRDRHGRRRHHEPRRDRLPRVRPPGRHRHGVRHQEHQDRPADPRRRQHRPGHHPRLSTPVLHSRDLLPHRRGDPRAHR